MCVPLAIMAVAAAASAYASYHQGQTAKQTAKYNAQVSQDQARMVTNMGAEQAGAQIGKARKIEGAQVAAGAAGGLRTDTGTPLSLAGETAQYGELDALRITNNAARQAYGYQSQANLDLYAGDQAGKAGWLNAGSSLLSSASNAYFGGGRR